MRNLMARIVGAMLAFALGLGITEAQERPKLDKKFWISEAVLAGGATVDCLSTYKWVYQRKVLVEGNPAFERFKEHPLAVEGAIIGSSALVGFCGWLLQRSGHTKMSKAVLWVGSGVHLGAAVNNGIQGRIHEIRQ
jgi:hypothetical protein